MRSRSRLATLVFPFVLACSGAAEAPAASVAVAPPTTVAPEPAPLPMRPTWLYEVHTDTQPSYVFAALDPGCPLYESFPHDYAFLFGFARQVILANGQTDAEAQAWAMEHGLDRSGSLERAIGAERLALLASTIDAPPQVARLLRPVLALVGLEQALASTAFGIRVSDARISPSHDAAARRHMAGASVVGLAEPRDMDRTMAAITPLATDALRAELDHLDDELASRRARLAAYRSDDETALLIARDRTTPGTARAASVAAADGQRLLDDHIAQIETELRAGNALAVLPYELVLGDHGLLARLRADGLPISRVSVAAPP